MKPSKIIISEGLFTLTEKVKDAFDFKIYVDVSSNVQKERFYRRAAERDLGSSADDVYLNAASKAKIHIHPTKANADIILSGEADRTSYKNFIKKVLFFFHIYVSHLCFEFFNRGKIFFFADGKIYCVYQRI